MNFLRIASASRAAWTGIEYRFADDEDTIETGSRIV